MRKPILARSTFIQEAARSLRQAANLMEKGEFQDATRATAFAAGSVTTLLQGLKGDKSLLPRGKW